MQANGLPLTYLLITWFLSAINRRRRQILPRQTADESPEVDEGHVDLLHIGGRLAYSMFA